MRLWSESFENARPIPAEFAMGQPDGFAPNRNPHLAREQIESVLRDFTTCISCSRGICSN